jgi:Flp pilus assembly protein CpaB
MRPTSRPRRPVRGRLLRPGLALRREPRLWWLLVISVALACGWVVAAIVARADHVRLAWGTTRHVLVAEHDLDPGDEIRPDDVSLLSRPSAMVPATALDELPVGAVVRARVLAGEVIVATRIAPAGLSGVAATLPTGTRAVAIPTEAGSTPPLTVGSHVDVLVALAPDSAGGGPPGFAVASDVVVVAIEEGAVTVAVPRDAAPRIAVALGQGAVTLALIGA